MSELNPNHPVLQAMHDDWPRIAMILLYKLGGEIVLTAEDFQSLPESIGLAVFGGTETLRLKIVTEEEALAMAKAEGGLPN